MVGEICKKENSLPIHKEGTERTREAGINTNFYYACTYDVVKDFNNHREKAATLNHLKAKTVRL